MEIVAWVIAERVERHPNGNMSIHSMFNALYAEHFPAVVPQLTLFLRTVFQAHEAAGPPIPISIRLINEDGDSVFDARHDVQLPAPTDAFTWAQWDEALVLDRLPIPAVGEYAFEVWISGERRSVLPLIAFNVLPSKTGTPSDETGIS